MTILSLVNQGIAQAIQAAGDAMMTVLVAGDVPFDQQPGEDYSPSWKISTGSGFFEKVEASDYPGSEIEISDRTMVLLQCSYDVDMHDYVRAGDEVYHVYGVKSENVGVTRVLQKLLLRKEQKAGIAWESGDLLAV